MSFKDSAFDGSGNMTKSWDSSFNRPALGLFKIQPKDDNYLSCILFLDTSDYSTWKKATTAVARFYFTAISNLPNYKILDTSLTACKIDGIDFQKEYVKCCNTDTKDRLYSFRFSRLYRNFDININIHYTDQELGKDYLRIVEESKFEE